MGDFNSAGINDSSENKLAQFCLDHSPACIFRLDQAGRIHYANHKACDSLCYSQAEFLKMSVFDIDPAETQKKWGCHWQQLWDAGSITFESRYRRKDGTVFPIEVTATRIAFEGRQYAIVLSKDITEHKRIIESLRIAQFMFDKAPFGIFLTKDGGYITDVNRHACQYLGYTRKELVRMNIQEIDQYYSPQEIEKIWLKVQNEGAAHFESIHCRKDGTDLPVEITGFLLKFNDDLYSVSFVQDISDRKKAEAQHRKMEDKIRKAQKMESLGTLAGGIAHDFNNILAAILGYSELAQYASPADSKLQGYLSQISQSSLRAKNIVQQILTFSRQGLSEKKPIDISRVIDEALQLIMSTLPATIDIIKNISPNLSPVVADETQVHQIVMNLCTNAYHAMKNTGGMLNVSLTAVTIQDQDMQNYPGMNPGHYLKLSIADTGCGIPPETINQIFDPYFTTKPAGEGTGLGLSTVHGIVKNHGGSIRVYSEVGSGTIFHVLFPSAVETDQTAGGQAGQFPPGSGCILFVDDEKPLIELGRDQMKELGYQVETRGSAIDAIEAFRADPMKYDLVITDMAMPGMTGDEMIRHIKTIRPKIPIIICSGFSDRLNPRAMEAIGINAVLMKPVIFADLAHTIRQVLETDS